MRDWSCTTTKQPRSLSSAGHWEKRGMRRQMLCIRISWPTVFLVQTSSSIAMGLICIQPIAIDDDVCTRNTVGHEIRIHNICLLIPLFSQCPADDNERGCFVVVQLQSLIKPTPQLGRWRTVQFNLIPQNHDHITGPCSIYQTVTEYKQGCSNEQHASS